MQGIDTKRNVRFLVNDNLILFFESYKFLAFFLNSYPRKNLENIEKKVRLFKINRINSIN